MTLRFHFVDENALAADATLAGRLAARLAADAPLPDFTVLTPAYLAALPADAAPMPAAEGADGRTATDSPAVLYAGPLDALPDRAAAMLAAGWSMAVVVPAPPARMPALVEALRPRLYLSHPHRSFAELRSFANQIVGDSILFSEYSAVRPPLLARPTRLGRFLRQRAIDWVLRPLGLW